MRTLRIVLLWVCLLGLPIVGFWMGGLFLDAASRGRDIRSHSRYAKLELALHLYHEEHGAFPPTKYQPVADGPIHSWRVLLLPHTTWDYGERYLDYDFSQEGNSRNNLKALGRMAPGFFWAPVRFRLDGETTHYLAIGDDDEWPSPSRKPLRSLLVTKGRDRFLVVEYPDSEVHWMEPKY